MRPEDRDSAYLLDITLAARAAIQDLGERDQAALERDEVLLLAIERRLIVLGEAARRVSGHLKRSHPGVSWRDAVGTRNILVHEYGDVDVGQVVRTVREDLPKLIAQLELLLPPNQAIGPRSLPRCTRARSARPRRDAVALRPQLIGWEARSCP